MIRFLVSLLALTIAAQAAAQSPHTHDHSFGDADKWAKVFDDPKRDAYALDREHAFLPNQYFLVFKIGRAHV